MGNISVWRERLKVEGEDGWCVLARDTRPVVTLNFTSDFTLNMAWSLG